MSRNSSTKPAFEAEEPLDYYELLQVSPKADPEIIEAAFRRLALKYHPDHNPDPQALGRMQALNEAYAVLKDARRRSEYDLALLEPRRFAGKDDFSDDDYIPPRRAAYDWNQLAPKLFEQGSSRLAWVLVGALLGLLSLFWIMQNTGSLAADPASPSPSLPGPTLAQLEGTLFADDFETSGAPLWQLESPWHVTTRYSASGKQSLWFGDEARGRYNSNLKASVTMARAVALPEKVPATLRFRLSGQSDHDQSPTGEDRLIVEVAEAGRDYQTLYSANGLYTNWQEISLDLGRWKGKAVLVRFRFVSGMLNAGAGFSGFFLDDVRINANR